MVAEGRRRRPTTCGRFQRAQAGGEVAAVVDGPWISASSCLSTHHRQVYPGHGGNLRCRRLQACRGIRHGYNCGSHHLAHLRLRDHPHGCLPYHPQDQARRQPPTRPRPGLPCLRWVGPGAWPARSGQVRSLRRPTHPVRRSAVEDSGRQRPYKSRYGVRGRWRCCTAFSLVVMWHEFTSPRVKRLSRRGTRWFARVRCLRQLRRCLYVGLHVPDHRLAASRLAR